VRLFRIIFIYIFLFSFSIFGSITNVTSQDSVDAIDNDGIYNNTQTISINIETDTNYSEGTVEVFSPSTFNGSGQQSLTYDGTALGKYYYSYDLSPVLYQDSNDYFVTVNFSDDSNSVYVMTLDSTAPTCSSIAASNSLGNSSIIKTGDTLTLSANISDTNITLSDIEADLSNIGLGASVNPDSFTGGVATWNVVAGVIALDGVKNIDISATTDQAKNSLSGSTSINVTADNTAPNMTAIVMNNKNGGADDFLTSSNTVDIVASITESNMQIADITADLTSLGLGSAVNPNTYAAGDATWTVTPGVITDGSKNITFSATDDAGNTLSGTTSHSITVDNVSPSCSNISITNTNGESSYFMDNDTLEIVADISEANYDKTLIYADLSQFGGGAIVNPDSFDGSHATWEIVATSPTEGIKTFTISGTSIDKAENTITGTLTSNITFDKTQPATTAVKLMNSISESNIARAGDTVEIVVSITDNYSIRAQDIFVNTTELSGATDNQGDTYAAGKCNIVDYVIDSGLAEGSYDIWVNNNTTDEAGNMVTSASTGETIIIDNTGPAVTDFKIYNMLGSESLAKADDTLEVVVKMPAEANGDISLIKLDASELGLSSALTPSQFTNSDGATWEVAYTGLTQGTYTLEVIGTDLAGNDLTGTLSATFEVDATSPAINSITITNDSGRTSAYNSGNLTVTANITEGEGNLDAADILADLSEFGGGASTAADSYLGSTATWSIVGPDTTPGLKTFEILSTTMDDAGNLISGTREATIWCDTTAPSLTALTPIDGTYSQPTFEVSFSISDSSSFNSMAQTTVTLNYNIKKDATPDDPQSTILSTYSTTSPYVYTAEISITPTDADTVELYVTAEDDAANLLTSGLSPTGLTGDRNNIIIDSSAPTFTDQGGSDSTDASHADKFVKAGDSIYIWSVISDNKSDTCELGIDLSVLDSTFSSAETLTRNGDTYEITTSALSENTMADGTIELTIYATDDAGNISSSTFEVVLDKVGPSFDDTSIVSSFNNDLYFRETETGEITVSLNGEVGFDVTAEISSMDSALSDSLMTDNLDGTYSLTLPALTGTMNEGTIAVVISATDLSDNTSTTEISCILDNTAPDFSSGTLSITDADNWYKEGESINFMIVLDSTETELDIQVDLSALGGPFSTDTVELSYSSGTCAVYAYTSLALTSTVNQGSYTIDLTATDKAGNQDTDSSLTVNTDRTPPIIDSILYFDDRFSNQLILSESSLPDEDSSLYYNSSYTDISNITSGSLEIRLTEANIRADLSPMQLRVVVPGKGTKEIEFTSGSITSAGPPDWDVEFSGQDLLVSGMDTGDSYEIWVYGTDSGENTLNTKILSTTLIDNKLMTGTTTQSITPSNILPTGFQTVNISVSDIDLYAFDSGFDSVEVVFSPDHFKNLRGDTATFSVNSTALTPVDTTPSDSTEIGVYPYESSTGIDFTDHSIYFSLHNLGRQRYTGEGTTEVSFDLSFDLEPLNFPSTDPAPFLIYISDSETGKRVLLDETLEVSINSPVSDALAESYPLSIVPGEKAYNYIYIRPFLSASDAGFDRIIVTNNLNTDGDFEIGVDTAGGANSYIDNSDSIEVFLGSTEYNIENSSAPDSTEVAIFYEGNDTFEIVLGDTIDSNNSDIIKIKYSVIAPTAEFAEGSFEVVLKNSTYDLSASASEGNAITTYNNNHLLFSSRNICISALGEINPPYMLPSRDEIPLEFSVLPTFDVSNSGIDQIWIELDSFEVSSSPAPTFRLGSLNYTNVSTTPSLNEVLVEMVGSSEVKLTLGSPVNSSVIDKHMYIELYGKSLSGTGDFTNKIYLGNDENRYRVSVSDGNADGISNNNRLAIKTGEIQDDFETVSIFPTKVPPAKESTFTVKIKPDFDKTKNIDSNRFLIVAPSTFPISDTTSVRDSVVVKKDVSPALNKSYTEIYSGDPASGEALVKVLGQTIEVVIGDLLHYNSSTVQLENDATMEVQFKLTSQSTTDESGATFEVYVDSTHVSESIHADNTVSGDRLVKIKTPGASGQGDISPNYVVAGANDKAFIYTINCSVASSGEGVDKIYFNLPDNFTDMSLDYIKLDTGEIGGLIDKTAECTSEITANPRTFTFHTSEIPAGYSGTIEIAFTADTPAIPNYPSGEVVTTYLDNSEISYPIEISAKTTDSNKIFVAKPLSALIAEVNPSFTMLDTKEIMTISMLPTVNSSDIGPDSFEITLPDYTTIDSSYQTKLYVGGTQISDSSYSLSTYEVSANSQVLLINTDSLIKHHEKVDLVFRANIGSTREVSTLGVKAGSSDLLAGSKTATAGNADSIMNNNSLDISIEGYPCDNLTTISELSPKNVFANDTYEMTYTVSFPIDSTNEGVEKFYIYIPDGYMPVALDSGEIKIDTTLQGATFQKVGNDLQVTLSSPVIGTAPSPHIAEISFYVNTPSIANSVGSDFYSKISTTGKQFVVYPLAGDADSNALNGSGYTATVSNYLTSAIAEISPNYANVDTQTQMDIYTKLDFETGDSGIDLFDISFPTGYSFGASDKNHVSIYDCSTGDTLEIALIEYTPNDAVGKLSADGFTLKTNSAINSDGVYRISFNLKAPDVSDAPTGKTFSVDVANSSDISHKTNATAGDAYSSWTGNSLKMIAGETKLDSYDISLEAARNGFYKINLNMDFSSMMDNDTPPSIKIKSGTTNKTVTLTNDYYKYDKYTGSTYISISADSGEAQVSDFTDNVSIIIDSISNIYGGPLDTDEVSGVSVNPSFLIAAFPLPVIENKMLILVRCSEQLSGDLSLTVEQENAITKTVSMEKISNLLYKGYYSIDLTKSGQAFIKASGIDSDNISGQDQTLFNVIKGGFEPLYVSSGPYSLTFAKNTLEKDSHLIFNENNNIENTIIRKADSKDNSKSELEIIDSGFILWPSLEFNSPVNLKIDTSEIHTDSKTGIFRKDENGYTFLANNKLDKAGRFVLAADRKAPSVNRVANKINVTDNGSALKQISLKAEGKIYNLYPIGKKDFEIDLDKILRFTQKREYDITIDTSDRLGNSNRSTIKYIPTSIGDLRILAYPVPASDYITIKSDGLLFASKALLKIYDVSGRLIFRQDITGFSEFIWDLVDRRGRRVANGVYFYKIDVDGVEREGKLVVLR